MRPRICPRPAPSAVSLAPITVMSKRTLCMLPWLRQEVKAEREQLPRPLLTFPEIVLVFGCGRQLNDGGIGKVADIDAILKSLSGKQGHIMFAKFPVLWTRFGTPISGQRGHFPWTEKWNRVMHH